MTSTAAARRTYEEPALFSHGFGPDVDAAARRLRDGEIALFAPLAHSVERRTLRCPDK